jgi:hypothetical protein
MTRLFLAAGVAALAIAMPASAKPGGGNGGGNGDRNAVVAQSRGGGGHGGNAQVGGGGGRAFRVENRGGGGPRFQPQGFARRGNQGFQMRSVERRPNFAAPRMQRQALAFSDRGRGHHGGIQVRSERGHAFRMVGAERRIERGNARVQRVERMQARNFERRPMRVDRIQLGQNRALDRRRFNEQRFADRTVLRDQFRPERLTRIGTRDLDNRDRWDRGFARAGFIDGCPPGLWMKDNGCLPPGQAKKLFGRSIADAERFTALNDVPLGFRALYPDTPDYYYRYGDGYLYRVDRTSQLISALLPLIGGGYVPGMAFPSAYNYAPGYTFPMGFNDPYVPDYYGFNAFYPDTQFVDYRYLNGNVYGVDPYSGLIEDVIPTYAYGYGVGQVLPASYGYYNVPYQYRDLYYDTSDYNYWYAPGAIYQVDPSSQLITSVASLLSPGLSIGQPLPLGYDVYNVPYAYRATYYDTPTAWYRYNNGYIYQIDPTTRLVTAIVASLLT